MARRSLLAPFRRTGSGPEAVDAPRPTRRAPASELRRERRVLLRLREERIRDLGGLTLEMYRQDSFREHLLFEQCAEIAEIEERLHQLDALLVPRRAPTPRCVCGAPIPWRSHFCSNCGRPLEVAPVAPCRNCGHALAADARFCPHCASPTEGQADDAAAAREA